MFEVANGCTLDFGGRTVTVAATGEVDIGPGSVTIRAGSFTMAAGALIDGRGDRLPGHTAVGGMIMIQTTGDVAIRRTNSVGQINVSADETVGQVLIDAGGAVTVEGRIDASSGQVNASGGFITIRSGGAMTATAVSELLAIGSRQADGGELDVDAGGSVQLAGRIDVSGGDGGVVSIFSDADVTVTQIDATGVGDAGSGNCVEVTAGTSVQITGSITADGTGSSFESGGGCGAFICVEAKFGDVNLTGTLQANGGPPDGAGGEITVISKGSATLASTGAITAHGEGAQSCGGDICIEAHRNATVNGPLDTSGGAGGSDVDISSGLDLTIASTASVHSEGKNAGSFGGNVCLESGSEGTGNLLVQSTIDASGGGCGMDVGCGSGGLIELTGCNVTLAATGRLIADAADAGQNCFSARQQLTISGTVSALKSAAQGSDGMNEIEYPIGRAAVLNGSIQPPADSQTFPTCTMSGQTECLLPCPTCGDGVVELPETCDDGPGMPQGCDGCSSICQIEDCNDGLKCTIDTCDAVLGCRNVPATPPCFETPPATPTLTPTGIVVVTPTPTATLTVTMGPSFTATATLAPSETPTPPAPSATPTAVPTSTQTNTPRRPCVGDCNGDGRVTTDELVRCVDVALSDASEPICNAATATVDVIVQAVDNALKGCN